MLVCAMRSLAQALAAVTYPMLAVRYCFVWKALEVLCVEVLVNVNDAVAVAVVMRMDGVLRFECLTIRGMKTVFKRGSEGCEDSYSDCGRKRTGPEVGQILRRVTKFCLVDAVTLWGLGKVLG